MNKEGYEIQSRGGIICSKLNTGSALLHHAGTGERVYVYQKAKELCHMSTLSQVVQAVKVLLQLEGQTREPCDHCGYLYRHHKLCLVW